jgi:type IV secretion system protein VirB11
MSTFSDRLMLIEDTPELHCTAPNKIQALVAPPAFTFRHAVMSALRLRPDRIIVGEVRDGAALDLLKAWNTGHPGGLATIHANDPKAMLSRMVQLIEEVALTASPVMVAEAVNLCVHITRDPHHPAKRRLSGLCEVLGWDGHDWMLRHLEPDGATP